MSLLDLSTKTALVTGASGAIGSAIARLLHECGATVILSGTRTDTLQALADSLNNTRTLVVPANLSQPQDIDVLLQEIKKKLDHLDILVNNAGMTRDGLFIRMKEEDWKAVLDVNLYAIFHLTRGCIRDMIKQRWGRIISITSVVAQTGNPGQANYVTAKAGLIGMSKCLAAEVASKGVTVNCIAPGLIESPLSDKLPQNFTEKLIQQIPIRRIGKPDEVAYAVAFLASRMADYITGHTLNVNGGMAML